MVSVIWFKIAGHVPNVRLETLGFSRWSFKVVAIEASVVNWKGGEKDIHFLINLYRRFLLSTTYMCALEKRIQGLAMILRSTQSLRAAEPNVEMAAFIVAIFEIR
jgi:hypothetical protein